jgi:hypothetical protein
MNERLDTLLFLFPRLATDVIKQSQLGPKGGPYSTHFLLASVEVNHLTISGTSNVFLVVTAKFHFSK